MVRLHVHRATKRPPWELITSCRYLLSTFHLNLSGNEAVKTEPSEEERNQITMVDVIIKSQWEMNLPVLTFSFGVRCLPEMSWRDSSVTGSSQRDDDSSIFCLLINTGMWKLLLYSIRMVWEDAEVMHNLDVMWLNPKARFCSLFHISENWYLVPLNDFWRFLRINCLVSAGGH